MFQFSASSESSKHQRRKIEYSPLENPSRSPPIETGGDLLFSGVGFDHRDYEELTNIDDPHCCGGACLPTYILLKVRPMMSLLISLVPAPIS
jgi:hypothetical protein